MIRGLKPYPAYKDSGVKWLGEVPEHWDSAAVRRYCRVFAGATPSRAVPEYWANGSIPWLSSGEVNLRRITKAKQFITEAGYAASSTKWIRPRSLVLALAGQGRTKGMVATVECRTTCNQSLAAIEPSPGSADHRFLAYYLESRYLDLRALVGDGLRDGLNLEHVQSIPTPLPPLKEQSAIVRFLDHVDRRIQRYIRARQKLIALLHEQRQAIIHRAVTRGLAPNVRLKPSGVEWLGDVPEDWEVAALRLRYSQRLGKMLDTKRILGVHSLPYLRNVNVHWDRINTAGLPVMDIAPSEYQRYTVRSGDLLVCEGGEVGRSAIWNGELARCGFQKALHRLRPLSSERDLPRFLLHALQVASKAGAFDDGHQSTIAHLTGDKLRAHRLAFPPKAEQVRIVAHLDREFGEIDRTVMTVGREISLLREFRTRLIADVVTGKLDVREAAARLPVEAEEPELLDAAGALAEGFSEETETTDPEAPLEEAEA